MDSPRAHTDCDHHPHGARGLVVGPQTVSLERRVRFPSRTPQAEAFASPGLVDFDVTGHAVDFASVAQPVERGPEVSSVGGSNPSRGTARKRKRLACAPMRAQALRVRATSSIGRAAGSYPAGSRFDSGVALRLRARSSAW